MRAPKDPLPPLTEEGAAILEAVLTTNDNLQVVARAGCGKTTILQAIATALPRSAPYLYVVFNKTNREEAEAKFPEPCHVRTWNGLGHRIWADSITSTLVLEKEKGRIVKNRNLLRASIAALPKATQRRANDEFYQILDAVSLGKNLGFASGVHATRSLCDWSEVEARLEEPLSGLAVDLAQQVIQASIAAAYRGIIDFDDQVYMPALFGGAFPNYPTILVDEQQDQNPIGLKMLSRFKRSRIITVGDDRQSIYAFRGAVTEGMALSRAQFGLREFPLTVSFRCRQEIVENARWRAPDLKWVKDGGRTARLRTPNVNSFPDSCAIICRNNAPLFAVAVRLLNAGRSVRVIGSDVGPRLIALMRRLGPEDMSKDEVLEAIADWEAERLAAESKTAKDMADCMRVFAEMAQTLAQAIAYAQDVLKRDGTITLTTGHRAKGLEWPVVFHLDPWLIRDDRGDQELNLRYVIQTRAMDAYFEINSTDIRW